MKRIWGSETHEGVSVGSLFSGSGAIAVLALLIVGLLGLVACGGDTPAQLDAQVETPTGFILEVEDLHIMDVVVPAGFPGIKHIYSSMLAWGIYEAQHPWAAAARAGGDRECGGDGWTAMPDQFQDWCDEPMYYRIDGDKGVICTGTECDLTMNQSLRMYQWLAGVIENQGTNSSDGS